MNPHWNLPNSLTLSRLAAIPILVVLIPAHFAGHDQLATAIFLLASLTDTLDGQLARRRRQVTELGKFLDPLADKLFILSVLVVLVQEGLLQAWIVVVIFGREILITVLRSLGAAQGRVVAATPWGKTKTVTQIGAVLLLMLQRPYPAVAAVAQGAILLAVAFTVASGIDYLWRFRFVLERPPSAGAVKPLAASGGAPQSPSPVDPLARELGAVLSTGRLSLAVAESCTGGLLAAMVTDSPGSSQYFKGGVVAYSDEVKRDLLGVPDSILLSKGAVSAESALAMAVGVRERLGVDLGVSITGIAGPEAEGTTKPVGLTYIAVSWEGGQEVHDFRFPGDRWQNRRQAVIEAIRVLLARASGPRTD